MTLWVKLKFFRWGILILIPLSIIAFFYFGGKFVVSVSDLILFITALLLVWYAHETLALVELTRIKDQPLLEVEFQNNGAEIVLKNIGQSPAYSPSISALQITDNEYFDFDPLHSSRLALLPGESRKVWMHHQVISSNSIGGFVESIPALRNAVINRGIDTPLKISLQYFDKDGVKILHILYVKMGGNKISNSQYIYTSTTSE
jgi:hypothetical protein